MPAIKLTARIQKEIVAFIRAGGYPEVAAEAAGVPREVFREWMARAERSRTSKPCRELADAVRQAQAQARLTAETETRSNKPLDWLKCGPGKDAAHSPGWTGPARPSPLNDAEKFTLNDPIFRQFLVNILDVLTPFPEARAAVANKVAELDA